MFVLPGVGSILFSFCINPHSIGSNGAVLGTVSAYMSACHMMHVPRDVDLVLVEYRCLAGWQG